MTTYEVLLIEQAPDELNDLDVVDLELPTDLKAGDRIGDMRIVSIKDRNELTKTATIAFVYDWT